MLKKNLGKLSAALLSAALLLNLSTVSLASGTDLENNDTAPVQVQASDIQESPAPGDVVISGGDGTGVIDPGMSVVPEEEPVETPEEEPETSGVITTIVDGETYAPETYLDGVATTRVDASDKTILTVIVDGETVVDNSYVLGDGSELPSSYEITFEDGADHTVEVVLGYKVVVTTYYVKQDNDNETYWGSACTLEKIKDFSVATPTTATYVVVPGVQDQPVKLLPTENVEAGFPFERLDYMGYTTNELRSSKNILVVPGSGQLGSDWDTYYTSETEPGAGKGTSRFMMLGDMPAKDCTLAYAYNYHRVALFANYTFELVDGTLQAEQYVNPAPPAPIYAGYHCYDTAADGNNAYAFGGLTGNSAVFGDVVFPEGTTANDYVLKQSAFGADYFTNAFGAYYQWPYSAGWDSDKNADSTARVLADTGLTLDYSTGLYSGTLTTRLASRNYFCFQTFSLIRPVVYHANNGAEQPQTNSVSAVKDQVITVAANSFVRNGYRFTGWNTAADGSGESFAPDATFTMGAVAQVDLYAQWEIIPFIPDEPYEPSTPDKPVTPEKPEVPEITVPEEDVPLTDLPTTEIPEEEVPMTDLPTDTTEVPSEEVEIANPDVPLGDLPQTGTSTASANVLSAAAAVCALLSAVTAAAALLLRKKEST